MAKKIKLSDSEKRALSIVSRVGLIEKDNVKNLGLSTYTLNKLVEKDMLKREDILWNKSTVCECFTFDNKGRTYAKNNFDSVYSSQHTRHDIELQRQYSNLSQEQQNNWINENQFRQIVQSRIDEIDNVDERTYYQEELNQGNLSMPDGGYFTESGTIECIEIITNSYGQLDIEHKQNTISFLGASCNFIKI